jgi:hypothetical protein
MMHRMLAGGSPRYAGLAVAALALNAVCARVCVAEVQKDTLPVIQYRPGYLNARFLPYGSRFRVRGSAAIAGQSAQAVRFVIAPSAPPRRKHGHWRHHRQSEADSAASAPTLPGTCWIAGPGSDTDTFDIVAPQTLRLGNAYTTELTFYRRLAPDSAASFSVQVLQALVRRLSRADSAHPANFDARLVDSVTADVLGISAVRALRLEADGTCNEVGPESSFSASDKGSIGHAALLTRNADDAAASVAGASVALSFALGSAASESLKDDLPSASQRAPAALRSQISAVRATLDFKDPDSLVSRRKDLDTLVSHAESLHGLLSPADLKALSDLASAAGHVATLRSQAAGYASSRDTEVAALKGSKTAQALEAYLREGMAVSQNVAWESDTARSRALFVGTSFAIGPLILGNGASSSTPPARGGTAVDVAALALLTFHLGAVDKSVPQWHSSIWGQLAVDVGFNMFGAPRYHGQQLGNLFAGISPAVGVSFDATRFITVHVGALFLRQPDVSPLNPGLMSGPKVGYFVAAGVDFNLINGLLGLLNGKT